MRLPFKKTKDGIVMNVRVQPRSSRKGIGGVVGETIKVNLTAPPVDGAANEQLIEVLSEELGIARSSIRVVRGLTSRQKVVVIKGLDGI
ncbi:MAG TPA: DUF167 domain-containing protein [Thermodesulfovibrionales bacterium]|nr:DUF167 domain-containing protein [Thermodesulfovibrionales bacterium]